MTKRSQRGKTNAEAGGVSLAETWYFVRLAFLAIPWEAKKNKPAKGTLFKQYHLIRAKNVSSAFRKADRILHFSEHPEGTGTLNDEKVVVKKVGILDLEPLYEPIKSGVELFDESEVDVRYSDAQKLVIPKRQRLRMIAYEKN